MYNFISIIIITFSLTILSFGVQGQNNYPFNRDRSIKIPNPVKGEKEVTIYLKVQSTSTSQADGYGTYSRLLGASGFFIELADHKGKLAFYNGRQWRTTALNIREGKKDLFVIFGNKKVKIMNGTELIGERSHQKDKFICAELFLGSNFRATEKFTGELDQFMIFDRELSPDDMSKIISGKNKNIKKTKPVQFYNFNTGIVYQHGMNALSQKLELGIGQRKNHKSIPDEYVEEVEEEIVPGYRKQKTVNKKVETTAGDFPPEPYVPAKNNIYNFDIKFYKIDKNNHEYEGIITSKPSVLPQGSYDLIVGPNGKITIQEKTEVDRNSHFQNFRSQKRNSLRLGNYTYQAGALARTAVFLKQKKIGYYLK